LALILSNEIKGLPPKILRQADKILEIPMHGKKRISKCCGSGRSDSV
jgi:tRNA G18 (ribose-2'-O)-methylase SpoU